MHLMTDPPAAPERGSGPDAAALSRSWDPQVEGGDKLLRGIVAVRLLRAPLAAPLVLGRPGLTVCAPLAEGRPCPASAAKFAASLAAPALYDKRVFEEPPARTEKTKLELLS